MSRLLPTVLSLPAFALAVVTAGAQQSANSATTISITPAFEHGKGPVIAIDEAHKNTHTLGSPPFRGLVELLRTDGYQVRSFAEPISAASLTSVDVLLLSGPGGWLGPDESLSSQEIADLIQWVNRGGSLVLILDHMPAPRNSARLTAALGVNRWENGYVAAQVRDSVVVSIVYWRADFLPAGAPTIGPTGPRGGRGYQGPDARLAKHAITEGRAPPERVERVATFGGSAFQPPAGAEPLLTLPLQAISLVPPETPGALPVFTHQTPRIPVGEWSQGAVMRLGQGRVALIGESGLFSGGPAADNRKFVLNVMHWLTRLL